MHYIFLKKKLSKKCGHASVYITLKKIEIKFHSSVHPHDKKNNKKN